MALCFYNRTYILTLYTFIFEFNQKSYKGMCKIIIEYVLITLIRIPEFTQGTTVV